MSDVPEQRTLPYHEIDIPARFIRQAYDHIGHTQARYVTFIFTGENTEDAVCNGVSTRLMIADHRPRAVRMPEVAPDDPEPMRKRRTHRAKASALKDISDEVILGVLREGSKSTAEVADTLGIPTSQVPARQKVWRTLTRLHADAILHREGSGRQRNHKWSIADAEAASKVVSEPRMRLRPTKRNITRDHITEEVVLGHLREGKLTSKSISDAIGIPRGDASTRGKVTEYIRKLQDKRTIRRTDRTSDGGPIYELIDESAMVSAG